MVDERRGHDVERRGRRRARGRAVRAPSRCRSRRRISPHGWSRASPCAEIDDQPRRASSRARSRRLTREESGLFRRRRHTRHRRGREHDPQRARLCRRHDISGAGRARSISPTRTRSPGSALKPFIYGLAFDDLILHPSSLMEDEPTTVRRLCAARFRGAVPGRGDRARSVAHVAQRSGGDGAGSRRAACASSRLCEAAGARLAYPTRDGAPSLPIALGGLGISLADHHDALCRHRRRRRSRAACAMPEAPRRQAHRLFGPVAAWYLRDILDGVALPEGWAMGQGLTRKRTIGFKTGTSYGFRDAWSVGFSNDYTVGVWVGRADGTPRPGHVGRDSAAPVLLKIFDLLPAEAARWRPAPRDALLVDDSDSLPPALRHFTREAESEGARGATPPRILFPADGMTIETSATAKGIVLKARGGHGPLFWVVNDRPLGRSLLGADMFWRPDGEGFARIAVVDGDGRRAAVRIRVKLYR